MSLCRPALVGLQGPFLTDEERLRLRELRPAGVLLFARNALHADDVRILVRDVRDVLARAGVEPAVVAVDQEGGAVVPLDRVLPGDPSAASLGWVDDVAHTRAVHAERARALRWLGIDLALAPVADVDRPRNPVIATRAFGSRVEHVSAHVAAAIGGLHDGGVRACAKHWPGHGSPDLDSHLDLPHLAIDESERAVVDAPPFAVAARAGVDAMMLAHLHVPAWNDGPARPLGVDASAVRRLREETGFAGPLLSDAVEMRGLADHSPLALVSAGIDLVLFARPVCALGAECEELPFRPVPWTAPPAAGAAELPRAGEENWEGALRRSGSETALRAVRRIWIVDAASDDRLLRIPGEDARPLEGGRPGSIDLWREILPGVEERRLAVATIDPASAPPWTEEDAVVVAAVRPLPPEVEAWIDRGMRPRAALRFGAAALHREGGDEAPFTLACPEIRRAALRRLLGRAGAGWGY